MSDLQTWKEKLEEEMNRFDALWTPSLDGAWDKSSGEVEKEIAALADDFFGYYWEVFKAFRSETSLEEWQEKTSKFPCMEG